MQPRDTPRVEPGRVVRPPLPSTPASPLTDLRLAAARLEQGQAETPLCAEADTIASCDHGERPLSIVLTHLDRSPIAPFVGWLSGLRERSVLINLLDGVDLVEIQFSDQRYALKARGYDVQTFADLDDFISATDTNGGPEAAELLNVLRSQDVNTRVRNLSMIVGQIGRVRAAAQTIAMRARNEPTVLALTGPADLSSSDDLAMLEDIVGSVDAIWPIVIGDGNPSWLRYVPRSVPHLTVTHLREDLSTDLPNFITDDTPSELRKALQACHQERRVLSLAEMIDERLRWDLNALLARQKREARGERANESGSREPDVKPVFDGLKTRLSDVTTQLNQTLREIGRRAESRNGPLTQQIGVIAGEFDLDDIDQEASYNKIKLKIGPEVLDEVRRKMIGALERLIVEDCVLIRDALEIFRRDCGVALEAAGCLTRSVSLTPPFPDSLLPPVAELIHLAPRYRGEMVKRGFLQRLGEGRRTMFVVLMAASLIGSFLGFNVRRAAGFGIFFLVIFVASVVWTYFSWQKQDVVNYGDEVAKARDALASDCARVVSEALRERQTRLQTALEESRRATLQSLDAIHQQLVTRRLAESGSEIRSNRAKLKVLEQRIRDVQPLTAVIERARAACEKRLEVAQASLESVTAVEPSRGVRAL